MYICNYIHIEGQEDPTINKDLRAGLRLTRRSTVGDPNCEYRGPTDHVNG